MVPSEYLSNFWRTLQMSLFNCEINLIITWSANCFIIVVPFNNQVPTFAITDTKVYVPAVTLSTQHKVKLFSNWNQVSIEQLTGKNINQK